MHDCLNYSYNKIYRYVYILIVICLANLRVFFTNNTGREVTAGGSPGKVTRQLNFSSDIPHFWPVKLFSLKQSLVKYTPTNVAKSLTVISN